MGNVKWRKISKHGQNLLVGSDKFDLTPDEQSGLLPYLNPDMVIARKKARAWLAKQPDKELIFFSFDNTYAIYTDRDYENYKHLSTYDAIQQDSTLTDGECDALYDLTQRHNDIREAYDSKIRDEFLKVSEAESRAMWVKMKAIMDDAFICDTNLPYWGHSGTKPTRKYARDPRWDKLDDNADRSKEKDEWDEWEQW